ncbi:hypothetical protein JCM5353_000883 [Sporobolomyces roseus]
MNGYYNYARVGLPSSVASELNGITYFIDAREGPELLGCVTYRWSQDLPFTITINWPKTLSLDMQSGCGQLAPAGELLGDLEAATRGGKILPLERLKFDLRLSGQAEPPSEFDFFSQTHYQKLLKLLQRTNLQHLHLASLTYIPETPSDVKICSMKVLRLQGACNFRESPSFQNFSSLLFALPLITQLHLVGSSFFGPSSSANDVSKTTETSLPFRYPELSVLLTHLRPSNVVIFTYRGQDEKREMRWTRMNKEEDFVRDCWTL